MTAPTVPLIVDYSVVGLARLEPGSLLIGRCSRVRIDLRELVGRDVRGHCRVTRRCRPPTQVSSWLPFDAGFRDRLVHSVDVIVGIRIGAAPSFVQPTTSNSGLREYPFRGVAVRDQAHPTRDIHLVDRIRCIHLQTVTPTADARKQ